MAKPKISSAEHEQLLQTVQMFEVIAETQPNDVQSLEILKEAYLNLGRDSDAVTIAKKIAQGYVNMGQLSSAILEYEGILQKFPSDAESLAALGELEGKMSNLSGGVKTSSPGKENDSVTTTQAVVEQTFKDAEQFEDGNEALADFFKEHGLLSEKDAQNMISATFAASAQTPADKPSPSLIGVLSERGISSVDKCLALLAEKTRLPFIPLAFYDIDSKLAQIFDREFCMRHLVLPFDQISKTLFVATLNPFDGAAKSRVERETLGRVQWYLTTPQDLLQQFKNIFRLQ